MLPLVEAEEVEAEVAEAALLQCQPWQLPGKPGEPLLALASVPQLLVHDGVDGDDGGVLLLEQ